MKRAVVTTLKLGIPAGLFAFLLWQVDPQDYRAFWEQPKRWDLLLIAQLAAFAAIVISFVRWWILVRAFEIPFTLREALRLGFLGYLLNFISFGSVGGDVFKAVLVARDKPARKPEAVASVLLDRCLGLLGLVLLATLSLALFSREMALSPVLIGIRNGAAGLTVASLTGLLLSVYAGKWFDRLIHWFSKTPIVGETVARMARAVRLLRSKSGTILLLVILSVSVHFLLASTVYFVSAGVYSAHPTWTEHLIVVPPGMAAGALPLAPGGIGYQEGALAALFTQLPNAPENFSGILVATIYRLVTIAIAGIGLVFYWTSHGREFKFASEEAHSMTKQAPTVG